MQAILDLELLHTFVMVSRTGELKKAAQAIHRSQGAVSMQIKRLEAQLGSSLLERSNKGIKLTEAGETLLSYSEQMLKLNRTALCAMNRQPLSGELSFGIPTDYAHNFLQFFMPVLAAELPDLSAKITCNRSRTLRQQVATGQLDIAIVAGENDNAIELNLWNERLVWSAPHNVALEQQSPLPIAMFEDNCIVRDLCQHDLKHSDRPYQTVLSSPVMDNLATAVEQGFALSLLPESLLLSHNTRALADDFFQPRPNPHHIAINMIHRPGIDEQVQRIVSQCLHNAAKTLQREVYLR